MSSIHRSRRGATSITPYKPKTQCGDYQQHWKVSQQGRYMMQKPSAHHPRRGAVAMCSRGLAAQAVTFCGSGKRPAACGWATSAGCA